MQWLVWSNEHRGWWKPQSAGYTKSRKQAGRYSLDEATEICVGANATRSDNQEPQETMLPDV